MKANETLAPIDFSPSGNEAIERRVCWSAAPAGNC